MSTEIIKVPDLGDAKDVEVIELLVSVGDSVAKNDSLLVLESDKAAMEIPAPKGGVVKSIAVNLGDTVSAGSEILTLEVDAEAGASTEADADEQDKSTKQDKASGQAKAQKEESAKSPVESDSKSGPAVHSAAAARAAEGKGGTTSITLKVPDIGGEEGVEVIEIHIKAGDSVALDDSLITLESDKAAMDVPSTRAGKVKALKVKVGDKVSQGSDILDLEVEEADESATGPAEKKEEPAQSAVSDDKKTQSPRADEERGGEDEPARTGTTGSSRPGAEVYAGPAVRKLARELGVDLTGVGGTGAKSRILKEDLHEFVKSRMKAPAGAVGGVGFAPVPDIDFSQFGEVERVDMTKLHKVTAVNMQRNWSTIPHVAQFNEADVTDLEQFREQQRNEADRKGVKLTFLPFLMKACVRALQEYPQFNVSLHSSGEHYFQKGYYHIGFAVATEAGLVVPVIRDVDRKTLWQVASEIVEMTEKARSRKLTKDDMQGACFTISSLGAIGGTGFIPIINAPEVAILGVGKTEIKPVYRGGDLVPRKMLPLTLSYDHRAVNGVDGGLFSTYLARVLADIRLLLL